MNGLCTHTCIKLITILLNSLEVIFFSQQGTTLKFCHARIDDYIGLKIQNPFNLAQGHVQHQAHAGRQGFQVPDMRNRTGQFDMTHTLTAHLGQSDLDTTFFTDHTAVLQTLVLAAKTFIVLHRSEDLGAEQSVPFRLEGAVVDCLRLFDLAV